MTHEELLTKIDNIFYEIESLNEGNTFRNALRAIVELHKQYTTSDGLQFCVICTRTEDEWEYPCPTIQAIEKELA